MMWAAAIVVYAALSIWFFLSIMEYTYRKDKWYDYPILFPTLAIIHVSSTVITLIRWFK